MSSTAAAASARPTLGLARRKRVRTPVRAPAQKRHEKCALTFSLLPPTTLAQGDRPQLSEDQKQEIKEAFELFDTEKAGSLDYHELKVRCRGTITNTLRAQTDFSPTFPSRFPIAAQVAMRALGFPVKKEEVKKIVADYDKSGASRVSYDDFVELSAYSSLGWDIVSLPLVLTHPSPLPPAVTERYLSRDPEEEIRKAFSLFDEDGSGRISLKALKKVAKELGEPLSEDELAAMIDEFDKDGDGMINEEEFKYIMSQTSIY